MVVQSEEQAVFNTDLTAREISFAKVLAGNEKKTRDQALKKLVRWLSSRCNGESVFTEQDFMTIWTGLYYSMWMSDKPLVQEELAESLSKLVHCFSGNEDLALIFIKCFYATMSRSWAGLDQHRMDKFGMLCRRFLRQSLEYCARKDWNNGLVKKLMKIFSESVLGNNETVGLQLHFIEIFLEELAKVGRGNFKTSALTKILTPFIRLVATTKDARIRKQLNGFFRHLIQQTDEAVEFEDKFRAWKKAGFPGGDISCVARVDSDEEETEHTETEMKMGDDEKEEMALIGEKPLDPRAGSVHVELPQIPVPSRIIVRILRKQQTAPDSTLKGRRMVQVLLNQFTALKRGHYPLGMKKVPTAEKIGSKKYINKCARKLMNESLCSKRNKRKIREKIKRLNAKMKASQEGNDDLNSEEEENIPNVERKEKRRLKKKMREAENNSNAVEGNEENMSTPKKKKKHAKMGCESPCKSSKEAMNDDKFAILKSVNLVQTPKACKCDKNMTETSPDLSKKPVVSNGVNDSPKRVNGTTANVGSPVKNGIKKENTLISPKKRKSDGIGNIENVKVESKIIKKRRTSTGWIVDDVEPDKPLTPRKTITLEKKDPFAAFKEEEVRNDPWDQPLQEGETEIFIPNKRLSGPPKTPVFWQKVLEKVSPKSQEISLPTTPKNVLTPGGRRVSFNLALNREQEKLEYFNEVLRSPVPYDSSKKPKQSALKAGLLPSPINPFYMRKKLTL